MEQPVITVLLALITAGVLWIARQTYVNSTELREMRTLLSGTKESPGGLVARVNSLHDWRNDLQKRELDAALAENQRLRDRLHQESA
jgi:hypothetical protein